MNAINLLPLELQENSLSKKEVILSLEDALKAVDIYSTNNWLVLNWEGWVKYSEGKHGHSEKHRGTSDIFKKKDEDWETFVERSASYCIKTIIKAQDLWNMEPEYPDAMLYFCITAIEKPLSDEGIKEFEENYYFCFSATLRISGKEVPFEEITKTLELEPTYTHKEGTPVHVNRPKQLWEFDMWSYKIPVVEEEALDIHIQALWQKLKPHKGYLLKLKENFKVDVFLGYRSNSATAGLCAAAESLEMFVELNIPFQVSVIIA